MKLRTLLFTAFVWFLSVQSVSAQVPGNGEIGGTTIPQYLQSITGFIYYVLVPLVFAVAFVAFIWGIVVYFVAGGANEEKRDQGKQLAIWGIIGLFVMVSVWGLVNLLSGTFRFQNNNAPDIPTLPTTS
jgi:hypothetical protein